MNLRIGKIRRYNNKILIALPSFKIVTNLKINRDEEKDKPEVKSNKEQKQEIKPNTGSNKERKQDTKPEIKLNKDVKPNIEFKQDFNKPDTNKITIEPSLVELNNYEEERLLWY